MTFVLQIEQPSRLPLFLRSIERDRSILVTYERARARRFSTREAPALLHVAERVETWSEPGRVSFVEFEETAS